MRYLTVILATIIVAGCATPNDMRKHPPMSFKSGKTSKQVAMCISREWSNTKPTMALTGYPSNMQVTEDGYSVSVNVSNAIGAAWPVVLADISDTQTGSATNYYGASPGYGSYTDVVTNCQ